MIIISLRAVLFLLSLLSILWAGHATWLVVDGNDYNVVYGMAWFNSDSQSLNLLQTIIQRYFITTLWDMLFVPLLTLALWVNVIIGIIACFIFYILRLLLKFFK